MKHAKEPWSCGGTLNKGLAVWSSSHVGDPNYLVAMAIDNQEEVARANARRIVACVNALREIENPEAVDAVLMAALKVCNAQLPDQVPSYIVNAIDALREALVKLAIPTERS